MALADAVRAVTLRSERSLALETFPRPAIGPSAMLVRILRAGICGTDVEIYKGLLSEFPYPLIMGHEIVGEVAEIGPEAARDRGLQVGDRVIVEASLSCGQCVFCRRGENRHCVSSGSYGLRTPCNAEPFLWGGYAEAVFVPAGATVHRVPAGISLDTAVLITSVIANGVQWVSHVGELKLGDVVVVQGAGPQGLACCAAARHGGASLVIITGLSRDRERLEIARRFGADVLLMSDAVDVVAEVAARTDGRMGDLVVDVTGSPKSPQVSLDLVRTGGRIVHASQMGTTVPSALFLDTLVRKEATIRGVLSKGESAVRVAFDLACANAFPFDDMITDHFQLEEADEAFRRLSSDEGRPLKAAFKLD